MQVRKAYTDLAPGVYSWGVDRRLEVPGSGVYETDDPEEIYYLDSVLGHPASSVEEYSEYEELTVDHIDTELERRGLSKRGNKADKVERLDAHDAGQPVDMADTDEADEVIPGGPVVVPGDDDEEGTE